jgi:hypothetical protein
VTDGGFTHPGASLKNFPSKVSLGSVVTSKLEKLMCRRTPGWFGNPPVGVEAFLQYPNNLASRRAFARFGIHRTQAIRWLGASLEEIFMWWGFWWTFDPLAAYTGGDGAAPR